MQPTTNIQEIARQVETYHIIDLDAVVPKNDSTVINLEKITENKTNHPSHQKILLKYRGFFFALASSFCFSLAALIVTYIKDDYDRINIATWRFQGSYILAIPVMTCHHYKERRVTSGTKPEIKEQKYQSNQLKILGMLLLRSTFTINAFLLSFYALKYLSIGDVLVICSSSAVFVYVFADLVLGERSGSVPIAASVTAILGGFCILQPPAFIGMESFDVDSLIGTSLAFGSALLSAVASVLLRYSRNIHYSTATFVFGAWGSLESMVLATVFGGVLIFPNNHKDWLYVAALAGLTFLGQISIILALTYEKAGPVSLIRSVDVLFGYVGQVLFWNTVPDAWSLVGATLVCLAVGVIGVRKWIESSPEDGKIWKLNFVLK